MRRSSILVLMILVMAAASCKFLKEKNPFTRKERELAALLARQDSIRVADSIRTAQEKALALEIARLDSARLAEEARVAEEKKGRYNIIVGSFITPEFAKNLAESYRQQGYDTRIIQIEGNRFELVSAESHQNLRKAIARLEQFQDTVEIDAWLFIRE